MSSRLGITPAELGLSPLKFPHFRAQQEEAIVDASDAFNAGYRFVGLSMPTGSGKSLTYISLALSLGWRVCVLTSSKGLQDQLLRDFGGLGIDGGVGLVDARGRNNFECINNPGSTCEDGPYMRCDCRMDVNCPYQAQLSDAKSAPLVVTNYAFWLYINKYGEGIGDFDLLVCDEGHDAPQNVCSVMSVELYDHEIDRGMLDTSYPPNPHSCEFSVWRTWALSHLERVTTEVANWSELADEVGTGHTLRRLKEWKALQSKINTLSTTHGQFVWERVETSQRTGWRFEPLTAAEYAETALFRSVNRVLIVSATLAPRVLEMLGVPKEESWYREYPSLFPSYSWPVYYLPVVHVTQRALTPDGWKLLVATVDNIIRSRSTADYPAKGIIHAVSYQRTRDLIRDSRHSGIMMTHDPGSRSAVGQVEQFKRAAGPLVMVSPALSTGYDFPFDACSYQIILKMPIPETRGEIMQHRLGIDPLYADYLMAIQCQQAAGRGMRHYNDFCETFVLDKMFWLKFATTTFERKLKRRVPNPLACLWMKYFRKQVRWVDTIPQVRGQYIQALKARNARSAVGKPVGVAPLAVGNSGTT